MKKNVLLSLCGFFMIAAFFSCNEDNFIGSSVQPRQDNISVAFDTIHVKSETVVKDSVFLRNTVASLGTFTDPVFGTTKADFMAQLYCATDFKFPDDVHKIDSAFIYFHYSSWFGDSTMQNNVKVYELENALDNHKTYYSKTDVKKYIDITDKSRIIAEGSFTAGDLYSTDSVRALSTYSQVVKLPVSMTLAQRFLSHPEYFSTPEKFRENFKGIYATTDFGNGSIIYVSGVEMELCFNTYLKSISGKRDSLVLGAAYFPMTQEVKQVNRVEHEDLSFYLTPNATDSLNYIYAPAGMFTKITIPDTLFKTGSGLLSGKTISRLSLEVLATQLADDDAKYALAPPKTLLLINESIAQSFFKGFELNDGLNSFIATYDSNNKSYSFDLSRYAQKMIHKSDGTGTSTGFTPFTDMLMIPVSVVQSDDSENVRIDHVITPCAVKVRSGNHPREPMKLKVVYLKTNK